jgi:hypothetical protein
MSKVNTMNTTTNVIQLPKNNSLESKTVWEVMTITPQRAEFWLSRCMFHSPVDEQYCRVLAKRISRGEWRITGDNIVISRHNDLLDGVHRLRAVVLSNQSIESSVYFGEDPMHWLLIDNRYMTLEKLSRV